MKSTGLLLLLLACGAGLVPAPLAAQPVPAVVSYTLVDADTDLDIEPLAPDAVLALATLPSRNLHIRANTDPTTEGSVVFALSGAQTQANTENVEPYALFSDLLGDYNAWPPPVGSYELRATPYAATRGGGGEGLTSICSAIDSNPLPVELTDFSAAEKSPGALVLRSTIASELNNRGFVVERSLDGQQFAALGTVPGQGSRRIAHAYYYAGALAPTGTLYYRLQQVDADGKTTYSLVRAVRLAGPTVVFAVYPTLANDGQVHYALARPPTGTEVLELLTPLGQTQGRFAVAAGGVGTVALAGLPPGPYLLRLLSSANIYTERFVLP